MHVRVPPSMSRPLHGGAVGLLAALAAAIGPPVAGASTAPVADPPVAEVASGLAIPWAVLPLPDGSALVDERNTGRILRLPAAGGAPELVTTIPDVATDTASGGLLGLARSPRYRHDHLVYAYVSTSTDDRVVRFSTSDPTHAAQPVFAGIPKARQHNGGALAFGPDGDLYVGTGDGGEPARAQDVSDLGGKILRIRPDGSIPADNPYGTAVWSIGHRNVEGMAFDRRGRLWESELGESTWDEVNLIVRGGNGGWPLREGHVVGPEPTVAQGPGVPEEPQVVWTTKEASPSGTTVVGDTLYVTALRGETLWRVPIEKGGLGTPSKLFTGRFGRLRAVAPAPDGLWLGTTNQDHPKGARPGDDRILRVRIGRGR